MYIANHGIVVGSGDHLPIISHAAMRGGDSPDESRPGRSGAEMGGAEKRGAESCAVGNSRGSTGGPGGQGAAEIRGENHDCDTTLGEIIIDLPKWFYYVLH